MKRRTALQRLSKARDSGPGTPLGRYCFLLNELEKRYPIDYFSSRSPESQILEMIDTERETNKKVITELQELIKQYIIVATKE